MMRIRIQRKGELYGKVRTVLQKFIGPIAKAMSENDTIQSVAEGFMRTGPVTFGVCIFVILGNLPFDGYSDWLISIGLKSILKLFQMPA